MPISLPRARAVPRNVDPVCEATCSPGLQDIAMVLQTPSSSLLPVLTHTSNLCPSHLSPGGN